MSTKNLPWLIRVRRTGARIGVASMRTRIGLPREGRIGRRIVAARETYGERAERIREECAMICGSCKVA